MSGLQSLNILLQKKSSLCELNLSSYILKGNVSVAMYSFQKGDACFEYVEIISFRNGSINAMEAFNVISCCKLQAYNQFYHNIKATKHSIFIFLEFEGYGI